MEYHVGIQGSDQAPGTEAQPFRTISRAAATAGPGDVIFVHAGIYREWVNPSQGGTEEQRIVYQSAGDGEVVITGAEPVADWTDEGDGVWKTEVPNSLFVIRNPYQVKLYGDWLFEGAFEPHLGDVYLDGKSLYECDSVTKLRHPQVWPQAKYAEDSLLQWYAEVSSVTTTIWANFGGKDPRQENVEINVRPYCFWPEQTGRNYITVRGFTLRQASPQWAPPTALQEGLMGPHWSKGWIIENNLISESKCTAISLGKEISTGQNEWSQSRIKGGTQREQEVIFRALRKDWHKDYIGSHIVRNNVIHDCEQAGIVGHLGAAFSQIYQNRIYNIHHKRIFHGAEVGGIKLHASLDTQICGNVIYSCYRALWLDWQAQGTRISRNAFYDNLSEDFFMEVCHGPYMVDHNLFLSPMNFRNMAQGGAFVHNLFAGRFVVRSELTRYTPYHMPHETAVAGYSNITGGDDKYYNNIFIGDDDPVKEPQPMTFFEHLPLAPRENVEDDGAPVMDGIPDNSRCYLHPAGLGGYNDYPNTLHKRLWEYTREEIAALEESGKPFQPERMPLPVAIQGNLYLKGAVPSSHEPSAKVYVKNGIEIETDPATGKVKVHVHSPEMLQAAAPAVISTALLGRSYHAEMYYEEPDGSPYRFDHDFFQKQRPDKNVTPGPFEISGSLPVKFEL
ncbi:right-handed parallel beta-helix repeat-containing protein [Paenibacillus sp. MMS20-IR301]|uniref:right-handed parallel beta-helix repeat-containing protein n=1 Tax=Paenibacillus sp. MMS20-IR301 TaxID=2895946 RepID=UPI0028EE6B24|nr:right-handed parallel beta-helix repeat-containing protein [Paenibacillus sp. MMS20-IR301]WNS46051.1 right-handed parallel beta-helix repeat-containing protein [Paenibacillus sp. MMS20-IR301]